MKLIPIRNGIDSNEKLVLELTEQLGLDDNILSRMNDKQIRRFKRMIAKIIERNSDKFIEGTDGADLIRGRAGDDELHGLGGDDKVIGGDGNDEMHGGAGHDVLRGKAGNDELYGDVRLTYDDFDSNGYLLEKTIRSHGNDKINGGAGEDFIKEGLGSDVLRGGDDNDIIISYSDSNTPAENTNIPANVNDGDDLEKLRFKPEYFNPAGLKSNDKLIGGGGADTFEFRMLINAKKEFIDKHTNADGSINWGMNGVAGENNNYHDHWVDGIGFDKILDFSGAGGDGDKIVISGHTVTYKVLKENDRMVRLGIYSDQGADGARGNGAHDLDVLGLVHVRHDGNFNANSDVSVVKADYGSF